MEKYKKMQYKKQFWIQLIISIILIVIWIFLYSQDIYLSKSGMPECLIHYYTGYNCPGCGGTRAFDAMIHFHWIKSFLYHPAVLAILGIHLYGIFGFIKYFFCGKNPNPINTNTIIYIDFIIISWFQLKNITIFMAQ